MWHVLCVFTKEFVFVNYVYLLLCLICSLCFVSLCWFVYCLCVNVYYATDTGFQPNCNYQICPYLYTLFVGFLARSQYPVGPATRHLGTHFLGFLVSVYKRMLRRFPRLTVATACYSCSPPDLNLLVACFIFMYMHNNHCHRVTAQLQVIIIIIIIICAGQVCTVVCSIKGSYYKWNA